MKKLLSVLTVSALLFGASAFLLASCGESEGGAGDGMADTVYNIGICQLMPHAALDSATQGFRDALIEALGEDSVVFNEQNAQGDPSTCTTIINDFVTKDVDLIMANATNALQAAYNGTETVPILGTSVTEYGVALGIEGFDGTVGSNVSGTSDLAPLDAQADIILELFPETETVGMLYCSAEPNSAYQIKVVSEYLTGKGIVCKDYAFTDSNDITAVASAAASNCDVIYIPTDNTAASCAEVISGVVLPLETPVVGGDTGICNGCGVATIAISYYDLGYTTGKMAVKILTGEEKIEEMPIAYAENFTKVYNPWICEELGVDTSKLESAGYVPLEIN